MRKVRHIGDMEPLTVAERAFSPSTAEHFVTDRVVNGSANDLTFLLDSYRNAVKRVTMSKIGRSVKRIDNPAHIGIGRFRVRRPDSTGLFGQYRVAGIAVDDALDNDFFALPVSDGDEIRASLELHMLLAVRIVGKDLPRGARQLHCRVQVIHQLDPGSPGCNCFEHARKAYIGG